MVRIMFVCLGNICRSPMAEAIARAKVKEKGLEKKILIASSGTGNWHVGKRPHEGTLEILEKHDIDHRDLNGRQVKEADFHEFDYLIALDSTNEFHLNNMKPDNSKATIRRLLSYDSTTSLTEVPDPYFTGNFFEVYDLIDRSVTHLLEDVIKQHVSS